MEKKTSCQQYGSPKERLRPEITEALSVMPDAVVYTMDGIMEQRAGCQYLVDHPELRPTDPAVQVENRFISVPGNGHLRIRIYRPQQQTSSLPGILWLHGGGMAIGVPEADEGQNIRFAKEIPSIVIAVDYRLAPENPYPIPNDDCFHTLCWVYENASSLGIDQNRIAVAGMSGGGGLALSIAMRARDEGGPLIRFLSLASPMINAHPDSYAANQEYDPRTLNKSGVLDLWKYYAGEAPKPWNAYLEPIQGDYAGLPAVYTYAGELDPFRDDTIAMASKLWA